jgi:hypothetical protein
MAGQQGRQDPKEAAQAEARCLNPHPEQVTDSEFLASDFGSSPGRCAPARSRPRSPRTARSSIRECSMSWFPRPIGGSTPTPVVQAGQTGTWRFPDSPIGNSGDHSKCYTITLVLASPPCDKSLRSTPQIDGDYKARAFPAGCSVVQKVDVYVTYPQS